MQVRLFDAVPCCGDQPSLDTWDKNEMRSVRCIHCGKHTEPHWCRADAVTEWNQIAKETKPKG